MDASIIIPTYNRRATLAATLDALVRIEYPSGCWEVIVVDDGSTDGTPETVESRASLLPVRCLRQDQSGPAAARNRGAAAADGTWLVFLDDDIEVEPSFLTRHVEALRANPGCWILGRVVQRPEIRETPFGRYRDRLWESFNEAHPADEPSETAGIAAANLSLAKVDFQQLGGFDEGIRIASCEDLLLGIRARQAGIRILYDPRIRGVHNDWAGTLRTFCERQRLYSISDVLLWRRLGDASPRLAVIRRNGRLDWKKDGLRLGLSKVAKSLLAGPAGLRLVQGVAAVAERILPDTRLTQETYRLAVALATFRGVRQGFAAHSETGGLDP